MKKNGYLAILVSISGAVNIALNIYFVPRYGYQAAAITTLVSYFIFMLCSIFTAIYILKLPPLPLGRIVKYIVLLTSVIGINYAFGAPNQGMHFGWISFKILLFASLALALFYNKIGLFLKK